MSQGRKHIGCISLVLLISIGVLSLWCVRSGIISFSSEPFRRSSRSHVLKILTWNTNRMGRYKKPDHNEVLKHLAEQDADIICLQEVDVYKSNRYLTLPEVKQVLGKKYPYSYMDFAVYDRRHQFGTMVWSKYPLINKQSIRYETRANISNRCDVVIDGDTIRLFNNHLESYSIVLSDFAEAEQRRDYEGLRASAKRLEEKWSRALPLRNQQARVVRAEIEHSPYPVIVAGDFNSTVINYAYWHISRGLTDAWIKTNGLKSGVTCEKFGFGARIDYILTSPCLKPVSCQLGEMYSSDHKSVTATIEW